MPQELSEQFSYGPGQRRLAVAEDIVERIILEIVERLETPPDDDLRRRLYKQVLGAFLLHGVECPYNVRLIDILK